VEEENIRLDVSQERRRKTVDRGSSGENQNNIRTRLVPKELTSSTHGPLSAGVQLGRPDVCFTGCRALGCLHSFLDGLFF